MSQERAIEETGAMPHTSSQPEVPAFDLTSCDREPIHIPGSIQPHGFLLGLDAADRVAVASANAADFLTLPLSSIFGRTLPALFGDETGPVLLAGLHAEVPAPVARLLGNIHVTYAAGKAGRFDVVCHQAAAGEAAYTILEFEQTPAPVDMEAINVRLYNFVASIRKVRGTAQICEAAVEEVHALTCCDRVVLYSFNEQGHGLVLAETLAEDCFASYLGLRFPASDVPAQARRMHLANRVRIIPNVEYEPSPLLSTTGAAPEIDLSSSVLRSVSPIHRQYMRNMGTVCSMSISIIIDGALWGLVSCHHHAPRYVSLGLRSACDFILQIVASQIESQQSSRHLERALEARRMQGRLLASMAAHDNYMEGLARAPETLLGLVHAEGAAIVTDGGITLLGTTPEEADVFQLTLWLRSNLHDEVFSADCLSALYPPAAGFTANASGLLAIAVSKVHNTQVLWFRSELVQSVRWAGDPQKAAEPATAALQAGRGQMPAGIVQPRRSFEEWKQTVRGCSEPWTQQQQQAAAEFRSGVIDIVLRRAEEMAQLATGLQVANEELEAFSYSVSHDLRAPFRHISGFSEMLRDEEAERMSDRGRHYLATIMESARFAGLLVDSLLDFSRFARTRITMIAVDMEELVDREWQAVLSDEAGERAVAFARGALPRVMGDPQLLRQVLRNLFSNAVKYTGRQPQAAVRVEAYLEGQETIFSIADNGAGFDQQCAGKLFGVFQRLHRSDEFEGTGIGLANVRRIIGRHGGRVWATAQVGQGATFYFSMPVTLAQGEA